MKRSAKAPTVAELEAKPGGLVVERRHHDVKGKAERPWWGAPRVLLQLEYVNCGRCPSAHGPYWYAYRRVPTTTGWGRGRLFKVYVGKKLDLKKAERLLRERGALPDAR